ncbi:MAG: HAD family hydrolase [Candidatus Neomarinimicrobiota bacterium]
MLNTILLDLDATVLPMDMDTFVQKYFHEMGKMFHDLIDGRVLAKHVMECTEYMVKNLEDRRNEEVFFTRFAELVDGDIAIYQSRFDEFYDTGFLNAQVATHQSEAMLKAVKLLQEKGYNLVLATNPLFPMKANHHRIRWAGLSPDDFTYISSIENNHYCKPNLEYYREVLSAINKSPEDCMMVGNDALEDMIAAKLGIKTYLIDDHLLNKYNVEIVADERGSYEDFLAFVEEFPKLGK